MASIYKNVFTPLEIRGLEYKNRIEMAPVSPNYPSKEGYITDGFIDFFRPVCRGGTAIVTLGNCSVELARSQDEPRQVGLDTDDYIPGLSRFADMGDSYGCIVSAEVNHSGLDAMPEYNNWVNPEGPSPIIMEREMTNARLRGSEPIPSLEMSRERIKEIQQMYVDGAYRLKRAGFKMCMLHGGHTNLIGQFSSPIFNKRTDEYGGSTENRARFGMEIAEAVRKKCGEDFVIEMRFSADEIHPEGMHFEETKRMLRMYEDQGAIDIMNISAGTHSILAYFKYWFPGAYQGQMINVRYAAELKKIIKKCKITTVAGISNIQNAEKILSEGYADFVAFGRPLMSDPDMLRKAAHNEGESIRPCSRCGWCTDRMRGRATLACGMNPKLGRERELCAGDVFKAPQSKKIVIIGAGPGGMQAAITARERGHEVVVFEKEKQPGGNLLSCGAKGLKNEMQAYCDYMLKAFEKSGAELICGKAPTPEEISALKPDGIIIAQGAVPRVPDVPGADRENAFWAADCLSGKREAGKTVAVIGGSYVALEAAVALAREGKSVTVFKRSATPLQMTMHGALYEMLTSASGEVKNSCKAVEIRADGLVYENENGEREFYPCDNVLYGIGMEPNRELIDTIRRLAPESSCTVIGDCKKPRNIGDAIHEGFNAALNI
ncbi:MAG: NAD(P)/FAD-dependent oxidoreductase [Oscillospiraceae bacterium]|nr:NAD(P)/FAD-dependent oxidoreductase [Oscillospiraceae bacterium]